MRGATQTRKRRVGWQMERTRFAYRYIMGQEIALGGKHQGYYTNGQHAALRLSPFVWLALLIFFAVEHVHVWIISLVYTQLVFTVLFLPALFLWWAVRRIKAWWQFRGMDDAFADTVGEVIGWPDYVKPYLWLHFPMRWRTNPKAEITIDLKWDSAISEEKRKKILEAVTAGLGRKIDPRYVTWNIAVKPSPWPWNIVWPSLTIRPESPPPDRVYFEDSLSIIEKYRKPSQIPVGIGLYGEVEVIDIDDDAPHAVIAADSGRGKSSAEALVGAVLAHKECVPVILDPKLISLQAFKGLPNVVYCAGEEQAHLGLLAVKAEMRHRAEMLDVEWGTPLPDVGSRLVVLIEESDSLVDELRNWKEEIGEGRSNVKSISAMNRLRNMGRELKIHVFVVTQTGGAAALGGAGSQTGFGFQLISANHEAIWKKLAPQVKEIPAQSKHRGRWHLNRPGSGDTPIEVQLFGFKDPPKGEEHKKFEFARLYAMSGKQGTIPDLLKDLKNLPPANVSEPRKHAGDPLGHGWPVTHPPTHPAEPVGHGSHLRIVDPLPDEEAPCPLTTVLPELATEAEWLTLSEAMKAGVIRFPTINAARLAAKRSELLKDAARSRESSGANEWPRWVLERYEGERVRG